MSRLFWVVKVIPPCSKLSGLCEQEAADRYQKRVHIAHRYESGSLIITSNQPFSQWDHIFPDTMMTVAAIDRIIHHATIIETKGESYRKKQRLKN